MCIHELKTEARDRNLPWGAVREAFEDLWASERETIERPREIRQVAWMLFKCSSPGSWGFWRCGYHATKYGRLFAEGADHTVIPGYDEIARQVAGQFPEYDTNDGTERLWEFLLTDYERMPERATVYRRAMDRVEFEIEDSLPAGDTVVAFPERF